MISSTKELFDEIRRLPDGQARSLLELIAAHKRESYEQSVEPAEETLRLFDIWEREPGFRALIESRATALAGPLRASGAVVSRTCSVTPELDRRWPGRLLQIAAPGFSLPDQTLLAAEHLLLWDPAGELTSTTIGEVLKEFAGTKGVNLSDTLRKMTLKGAEPWLEQLPKQPAKQKSYRFTGEGRARLAVLEEIFNRMIAMASDGSPV